MSLISWDDLAEENPIIAKAQASLAKLDTSEAEVELQEQANSYANKKQLESMGAISPPMQPTTQPIKLPPVNIDYDAASTAMERAAAAVASYNEQMEFGERIKAVDKRLINSKTDLNQLIPFKYTWAWSMYLDSTEAHWMPTEADGYLKDIAMWSDLPTSEKSLVYRLLTNYMYSQYLYRPEMLVNLYRLSTNPEVRQYILRQAFEEQALHHSMRHIVESFDLNNSHIRLLAPDESTFKDRNLALVEHVKKLSDMQTSTATKDDIGDFLVSLAVIYGGMRTLYHLVPMYQIHKLNRTTGKLGGVAQNLDWILRDMNRQLDFGARYMVNIIEENPDVLTDSVKERIKSALLVMHNANIDFLSTLCVDASDLRDGTYTSQWFMKHLLDTLGIASEPLKPRPEAEGFITHFLSLNSKDHGKAQVSLGQSSGSSGGGSLDWE